MLFDLNLLKQVSETDLQIAQYISNHQSSVAFMRVRELAEKTHVSPATIVRFTKKMGYTSFPELRLALKQNLTERDVMRQQTQSKNYLAETQLPVDFEQKIEQLVTILEQASFIHCLGNGASGIIAQYAQQRFSTLGYRSIASISAFIPYLASKHEKKNETIDEVCLFFSISGESPDIVQLAKALVDTSIYTVSITNKEANHLATLCDFSLAYDAPSHRQAYNVDLSSQLSAVYIIEALTEKLYLKNNFIDLE